MNRRLLLALAPAAALALGAFAYAQPPGPGHGPVIRIIGPGGADMKAMHETMMKQHVEDLKTVLRLRPDQEAALQAFVASHHAGGPMVMKHGPGAAHGPAAAKPQTTPERLAEMARHEAAMAAEHEKSRRGARERSTRRSTPSSRGCSTPCTGCRDTHGRDRRPRRHAPHRDPSWPRRARRPWRPGPGGASPRLAAPCRPQRAIVAKPL